jgi:Ca2+-transporting ATPase
MTVATLAVYVIALRVSGPRALTAAFTALALTQLFHLGDARSREAVLSPSAATSNPYAVWAVAVTALLQLAAVYVPPLARVLGLEPLRLFDWAFIVPLAGLPAVIAQARKVLRRRRIPAQAPPGPRGSPD